MTASPMNFSIVPPKRSTTVRAPRSTHSSSRTSSGSRCSDNVVNDTRSPNRTLVTLRSATAPSGHPVSLGGRAAAPGWDAPHCPQKRASGPSSALHESQVRASPTPHCSAELVSVQLHGPARGAGRHVGTSLTRSRPKTSVPRRFPDDEDQVGPSRGLGPVCPPIVLGEHVRVDADAVIHDGEARGAVVEFEQADTGRRFATERPSSRTAEASPTARAPPGATR